MNRPPNPYRAAGTFAGATYTERQADRDLLRVVRNNQRIPYVLAPRQSGKSSLVTHIRSMLPPPEFRTAFVDFSIFKPEETADWNAFQARFFEECRRSLDLPEPLPACERFLDAIEHLLSHFPGVRLVIFLDEVDALLPCPFKDTFFSILRNIFNERASRPDLQRVQFVLAGAARPEELITDRLRSPFNVGEAIVLHELSLEETSQTCEPLAAHCAVPVGNLADAVFAQASGSVYLTQLILEKLWERLAAHPADLLSETKIEEEVQKIAEEIVAGAPHDIHFENIKASLISRKDALRIYRLLLNKEKVSTSEREKLWFTGLAPRVGEALYRNRIYEQVFHRRGPLDQVTVYRRKRIIKRIGVMAGLPMLIVLIAFIWLGYQNQLDAKARALVKDTFKGAVIYTSERSTIKFWEISRGIVTRNFPITDNAVDSLARQIMAFYFERQMKLGLNKLDLSETPIDTLPGLDKLTRLEWLDLSNTQIKELPGLDKLSQLRVLRLSNTQIKELPGLEKLSQLRALNLSNTQIKELPEIGGLSQLRGLFLDSTQIKELPGLEKLTRLALLNLRNSQITELPELEKLSQLQWLNLSSTQITELSGLVKLTRLYRLYLGRTQIKELPGLEKLTRLEGLDLGNTQIKELPGLEKLTRLVWLDLSNTQIKELSGLEKLAKFPFLFVSAKKVNSMSSFAELPHLKSNYFVMMYNRSNLIPVYEHCLTIVIGDQMMYLPGFEKLTQLQGLFIYGTQITELPGLEKFTRLEWLCLYNTQIIELPSLENCTSLLEVYLVGNILSPEQQAGLRARYPKVKFYFTEQELPK